MPIRLDRVIDLTLKYYKHLLGLILVLIAPFFYYFIHQRYVNHVEIYFNQSDEDLKIYKRFQETYGNEHQFLIVFEDQEIFTPENIDTIRAITDSVKKIKGVLRVFSLTDAEIAIASDDSVEFRKLFPEETSDGKERPRPAVYTSEKEKALSTQGIRDMLVSGNSRNTAIICEIENMSVEAKRDLMVHLIDASELAITSRIKLRYAGLVYLETELNYLTQKDNYTLTPAIILMVTILAGIFLKDFFLALITLANLLITVILSIGLFVMCGETFDMISAIMSPIILAISVSASIHLLAQYQQDRITSTGGTAPITSAMNHVWTACLFTSLTTCVGFLSFTVSDIRPVKIFGFYTAVGIMISFLLTMTFIPAVLMVFKERMDAKARKLTPVIHGNPDALSRFLKWLGSFTTQNPFPIFFATLVLFIICGVGIAKIRIETNQAAYFPESNPMKIDMDYVDHTMVGILPINLLLKATAAEFDFTHPESVKFLDETKHHITEAFDNISVSIAVTDYLKEIHKAFNNGDPAFYKIPQSRLDILDYYELAEGDLMKRLVSPDMRETRISFQSRMISNEKALFLFQEIETYLNPRLKGHFTYSLTGLTKLYLKFDENLMQTFLKSFSMAFILIFFMMLLVLRKWFLTLICMIPNIFPIALTLSFMGWFNIPLDVVTIMIASIVLGIAVDDTIHFTVRLQRNTTGEKDLKYAIEKTFSDVGRQMIVTSLLLFLGFGLLILGSVIPVKTFGLLTSFSMFFALLGDLIILPAVIMIFKPKIGKGTGAEIS